MDPHVPVVNANPANPPAAAAPEPNPQPQIQAPPPVAGTAQPTIAPPARRSRQPRGPVPMNTSHTQPGANALLIVGSSTPMQTNTDRSPNLFVPDASMLFYVLSICDLLMNTTDRFLRSAPAWLPIVSQLYISVLWNVMILKVFRNSGYGAHTAQIVDTLVNEYRIDECMIPGPLVAFFQSLAAINGPFEWIGDISPALPDFATMWDSVNFHVDQNYVRSLPNPSIILDQLIHFARYVDPNAAGVSSYATFQWYRNVYSLTAANAVRAHRLGPQLCGSLYTTQTQYDTARNFWSSALVNLTRTNATAGQPRFSNYAQFFGFIAQDSTLQANWFQHVVLTMNKYCQYFNGSVPLKTILTTGIGSVIIKGTPKLNPDTRRWIYPPNTQIEPFTSTRVDPRRDIPNDLTVRFEHCDHELEEQAEQYAMTSYTNLVYSNEIPTQNQWAQINTAQTHFGPIWNFPSHRSFADGRHKAQYAQVVASRFHQQAANRTE
uniref:Coat protein n=1 Tax=Raphanus sativus cryptic virus 4 TaxID=2028130 RepID=A0A2H4MCE1_9VIRU|nr:coat protein [Raphanus sativus cryptic virus 4]